MGEPAASLVKKRAIVIGASSEIGSAVLKRLIHDGYGEIYATGFRRMPDLETVKQSASGIAQVTSLDLADATTVDRYFQDLSNSVPALDALVYAAGTGGVRQDFSAIDPFETQRIFQINTLSAIRVFQCAMPMLQAASGSAVFVGSKAGISGGRRLAAYAASKAALHQWVISAARECASSGVRLNAVAPGAVDTAAMRAANSLSDDRQVQEFGLSIPIGRTGMPEEVSDTIAWLLSRDASYVTGAVVPLTGGS